MSGLTAERATLPSTSSAIIQRVQEITALLGEYEPPQVMTEHVIHGGMYCRTVIIPPKMILSGALIKRATIVILSGTGYVVAGDELWGFSGFRLMPASAGRKQVFVTDSLVTITMIFPTQAKTVEEAEAEFTDEVDSLLSRKQDANTVVITGE